MNDEARVKERARTPTAEDAYRSCKTDPLLGPVVQLTEDLLAQGLQGEEVAIVVASAFHATAVGEAADLGTANAAGDLVRALRHTGLDASDSAEVAAEVFSRRLV